MRDNIVGFYISFVRQKEKKKNEFFLYKRRTSILAYTVLLARIKKFVRVDTGRGVRIFGACDPFGLRS